MTLRKRHFEDIFFSQRFAIAVLLSLLLLFMTSCIKQAIETKEESYFKTNYLNSDFVIDMARDDSTDLTSQYNGYIFKLLENTLLDGPMTATKDGITYNGTWSTNEDYSKLTILITASPVKPEFNFLNRDWRFTNKLLPVLKFAPWGSTAPVVLYMRKL